jgi:mannose-1-phosphate guanylyltransferase
VLLDLWTTLLAGGSGRRLVSLTGGVPKQYWAFREGPTLVEETARRIAPLSPSEQRITVVDASHARYVEALRYRRALGRVVMQPADRGTAAGVLLGLTPILTADPDAIVLITPSDHGVTHVDQFQQGILAAASFVHSGVRDIVLFGVEPSAPAPDYGWVTPKANGANRVGHFAPVARFSEKPDREEAERLFLTGSVWSTMVLVGRARAIFAECQRHLPDMAAVFTEARHLDERCRAGFLNACYRALPSADFSRDVIAHARGLALFTWSGRMGWSDLGTPERLQAWRAGPAAPPSRTTRTSRRSVAVSLPGVA